MRILALVILASLMSCSSPQRETDNICGELALFANSVVIGDTQKIEFRTDWAGRFVRQEPTDGFIMAVKRCNDYGYEPGKNFCNYLISNASSEVPVRNFRRLAMCLGDSYDSEFSVVSVEHIDIKIGSFRAIGVNEDIYVTLGFTSVTDSKPATMVIEIQNEGPN